MSPLNNRRVPARSQPKRGSRSGLRGPLIKVNATVQVEVSMVAYADTDRGKKVEDLVRSKLNDVDLPEGYELESFTAGIFKPHQCEGDTSDVGDQPCSMNVANVVNGKRLCLDHTFGEMQKLKPGEKLEVESTPKGTTTPLKVDMILPITYWDGIGLEKASALESDDDED